MAQSTASAGPAGLKESPPSSIAGEPHVCYALTKRAIDILVTLVLLAVLSPLLVLLALGIRLTSRGPVFFRQERVGLGGQMFCMWKFRSMDADAEEQLPDIRRLVEEKGLTSVDAPAFKAPQDPRVTAAGRLMRRFSLDELPQLFNVLRGSMSLVGPRPLVPEEADQLTPETQVRHAVKPGITCIWQVSGRSEISYDRRMAMDVEYVSRRSLWLDIQLLLKTPFAVLSGRGAY